MDRKLHLALGMGSMVEYCERILGYDVHTARDRVRVAHSLNELPKLADAVSTGQLSYSAARELSRVATSDTGTLTRCGRASTRRSPRQRR